MDEQTEVMVQVVIDSIRVSLMSQHRVVILKEIDEERYLPIWIGPYEADAITLKLQGTEMSRPLTHDLLVSFLKAFNARVSHIVVNDLRNDTFYARIVMDVNGERTEVDSRPSDAIALAVRVNAPIFVSEAVMEAASIRPEEEEADLSKLSKEEQEKLSVFEEFVDSLDFDG